MTTLPASPASLTDAALDELDEDAGIFLSKEPHPREEYYQRRITRSRTRLTGTHLPTPGARSRIAPLDLVNETEPSVPIEILSGSTQETIPSISTESTAPNTPMDVSSNEQVADAVLPRTDGSPSPQNSSSGPSEMEKDSGRNQLINEYMQEGFGSLEVSSSTDAPVMEAVHSPPTRRATPPPTLNSDVLPSTSPQPPQTPSTDLICFESFRMASPTRGTHTPPQTDILVPQGVDLLSASPTTLPPRTPQKTPGPSPGPLLDPQSGTREKQLLFTPRTTASFAADVDVPINTALLMTREKDRPTSLDGLKEQTPEDQDAERPVKRIKAETPLRSHKHSLSSPVKKLRPSPGHVPQRARLLGQSSAARSPEKGRMLGASTSYRPIAPKTPTRPAIPSARVPPTISRQLFATPQRPSATPQRPATVSKTESARSTAANYPPSGAPKLPSDFRFVFQSNIAMPTSPEAQEHTHLQNSGEAKTVLLNDFKFVPAPISPSKSPLPSPAKPSISRALGSSTSMKGVSANVVNATPIKFNMALLSPKKVGAALESSPSKPERSIYGSPVRFVPPVGSRLGSSTTLQASTNSTSGPFKGKGPAKPALPVVTEAPNSPLKPRNGSIAVPPKSIKQAVGLVKPSALPKPKGFKISKLSKPTGIPVPQLPRTTTVNMVHVPHVDIGGSPTKTLPRAEPSGPAPLLPALPVVAPPPRKKIFRPVIPGTLTGWEGKPAPVVETQIKSSSPEAQTSLSGSPPEAASSDGDASSVKRSSRRTVSGPRTPSPEAPNDLNKAKPEEQSSPRRSRRISKEKENASTEDQPAKGPTKPVAAPRSRTPATPKAPPGSIGLQMSDKELKSLTMKNTVRNQTYFVEIDLQVVRKDCPRPPSPSSRVRAAIGIEEKEAEAKKRGRTERAKKRGLLEEEMDREEDESPSKHILAPGDDEEYETPKRRKLDGEGGFAVGGVKTEERFAALQLQPAANGSKESRSRSGSSDPAAAATSGVDPDNRFVKPNSKGRFVRWNKKLAFYCETGAQPKAPSDPSKGILAKDASAAKLDKVGNVPEAGIQPPEVRKNVVVVFKYVYADDPSDNLKDEDMDDDEEYVEAPSPPKKGKRKRLA